MTYNPPKKKYRYLLSFGSNLGDKRKNCEKGLEALLTFCTLEKMSPFIETPPLKSDLYKTENQTSYTNMICAVISNDLPDKLYEKIVRIEDKIGHNRSAKWLPRHLDIDILLWAKDSNQDFSKCLPLSFHKNSLIVPHEELLKRDFLLDLSSLHLKLEKKDFLKHKLNFEAQNSSQA